MVKANGIITWFKAAMGLVGQQIADALCDGARGLSRSRTGVGQLTSPRTAMGRVRGNQPSDRRRTVGMVGGDERPLRAFVQCAAISASSSQSPLQAVDHPIHNAMSLQRFSPGAVAELRSVRGRTAPAVHRVERRNGAAHRQ